MHVLHVSDTLGFGGAERMLVDIANCTISDGHNVSVCVTRSNVDMACFLHPTIHSLRLGRTRRWDFAAMRRMARYINAEGVDVLHVHGRPSFSLVAVMRLLRMIRTPVVFHEHFGLIERDTSVPRWVP